MHRVAERAEAAAAHEDFLARHNVERIPARPSAHRSVECGMRVKEAAGEPRIRSPVAGELQRLVPSTDNCSNFARQPRFRILGKLCALRLTLTTVGAYRCDGTA